MFTPAAFIPVLSWTLLNITSGFVLTLPIQNRLSTLPLVIGPAFLSFKTIQYLDFFPGLPELWGLITLIALLHFTALLYVKKWRFQAAREVSQDADKKDNGRMWVRIYRVGSNPRFIRVPYKDVILPEGPDGVGKQVKSTAVHRQFSWSRIRWLFVKIGVYYTLNALPMWGVFGQMSIDDFTAEKASIIRRTLRSSMGQKFEPISSREIMIRIWLSIATTLSPIIILDCIHAGLAVFFIYVLRIDTPADWPDLFGSPLEAYTLGRFWSV